MIELRFQRFMLKVYGMELNAMRMVRQEIQKTMSENQIQFTNENYTQEFWIALDSVARERKFLLFLQGPDIESTKEFIRKIIDKGWTQFLAISDKKVVGWCDITPAEREGIRHVGHLGMGVLEGYRRKGIGEQLLRTALADAFAKGLLRIELEVFSSNKAAIALYEKVGFRREGTKRKARFLDDQFDDIIFMGLLRDEAEPDLMNVVAVTTSPS